MRRGFGLQRRRTNVVRGEGLQERAQAMQGVQVPAGGRRKLRRLRARRNQNHLLAVREGNDGSLQADAGSPGVLPRVFPAASSPELDGLVARAGPLGDENQTVVRSRKTEGRLRGSPPQTGRADVSLPTRFRGSSLRNYPERRAAVSLLAADAGGALCAATAPAKTPAPANPISRKDRP